jgi:hypothetical protein
VLRLAPVPAGAWGAAVARHPKAGTTRTGGAAAKAAKGSAKGLTASGPGANARVAGESAAPDASVLRARRRMVFTRVVVEVRAGMANVGSIVGGDWGETSGDKGVTRWSSGDTEHAAATTYQGTIRTKRFATHRPRAAGQVLVRESECALHVGRCHTGPRGASASLCRGCPVAWSSPLLPNFCNTTRTHASCWGSWTRTPPPPHPTPHTLQQLDSGCN